MDDFGCEDEGEQKEEEDLISIFDKRTERTRGRRRRRNISPGILLAMLNVVVNQEQVSYSFLPVCDCRTGYGFVIASLLMKLY